MTTVPEGVPCYAAAECFEKALVEPYPHGLSVFSSLHQNALSLPDSTQALLTLIAFRTISNNIATIVVSAGQLCCSESNDVGALRGDTLRLDGWAWTEACCS
jgi:hypothetical protein